MANHPINRNQVSSGNENICTRQIKAPNAGKKGTHGVLNGRGSSGLVLRSTIIPTQTIANASRVPIDTNSPKRLIGKTPAKIIAKAPVINELT